VPQTYSEQNEQWFDETVVCLGATPSNPVLNLKKFRPAKLDYSRKDAKITTDEIFRIFDTNAVRDRELIGDIHLHTGIPKRTLRDWRKIHETKPLWRPGGDIMNLSHRRFTENQEAEITRYIIDNFIKQELSLSMRGLRELILKYYSCIPVPDKELQQVNSPERIVPFTCCRIFMNSFLSRNGLSYRKARASRRPEVSADEITNMLSQIRRVGITHEDHLVNMDESFWLVSQPPKSTVNFRGAESIHIKIQGDPKAGFTFIGTITKSGRRLPLYVIAKGKTTTCHKQFGGPETHPGFKKDVDYFVNQSESGWVTQRVFEDYMTWLIIQLQPGPVFLLMDQYPTHFSTKSKAAAAAKTDGLDFIPVPKGGTGEWQPLDHRIFGNLKAKGAEIWESKYIESVRNKTSFVPSKPLALQILLESWSQIRPSHITDAWAVIRAQIGE
jgi:hypothetical protein